MQAITIMQKVPNNSKTAIRTSLILEENLYNELKQRKVSCFFLTCKYYSTKVALG